MTPDGGLGYAHKPKKRPAWYVPEYTLCHGLIQGHRQPTHSFNHSTIHSDTDTIDLGFVVVDAHRLGVKIGSE